MKSVLLFVASLLVMAGTAHAALINGGFETGDFTGWQTVGDASIQTSSFGSGPTQGTYQAVLTNDVVAYHHGESSERFVYPLSGSPAVFRLDESLLGLPTGSLQAITVAPFVGEKDGAGFQSAIIQTFYGEAGSQLSFDWKFLSSEGGLRYDYSFVSLVSPDLMLLQKLAGNDLSPVPPTLVASNTPFLSELGFKTFSFILPETRTYTLGIGITQVADEDFDSGLIIDRVRVVSVPEPSPLLLLVVGIAGLIWWRWKQTA